ncbi:MAG: (Fe-S)-binding protein [Verrucomicrobia bacterium]|nr:(Fe-S)-binding protein [Verrucomicrobiota bacterium]
MHCGFCLPTCPTYDATKKERNSPRGRIALMRAIADGQMDATKTFAEEMYFCLGCLACTTACPAGVDYAQLFETARATAEHAGVLQSPSRDWTRRLLLKGLFTRPRLLRALGRMLRIYQASGAQWLVRKLGLTKLLGSRLAKLEPQTPQVRAQFSHQLIQPVEKPADDQVKYRVGLLTGCVQDLVFSDINRDTADALLANGCEVHTPPVQACCGSLHGHNGEPGTARMLARRLLDTFDVFKLDAIITNAAGCGSHLKTYNRLLADDKQYAERAAEWSRKCKDINEFLVEIHFRAPTAAPAGIPVDQLTYHEACHLCHGQKITAQPRKILKSIPGLKLTELSESTWCSGSAGIYNIVQPEMSQQLLERKLKHIDKTGARTVATANPGCHLQIANGAAARGKNLHLAHPVSLLAAAYRAE